MKTIAQRLIQPLAPNVVPLTLETPAATAAPEAPKPTRRRVPTLQHRKRFVITEYRNSGGSLAYRVSGYKRDGTRIRENYSEQQAAICRQVELETEFLARAEADTTVRATRLTDTQIRIAEACFPRLPNDEALFLAVDRFLRNPDPQSAVQSPRLDAAVTEFKTWLESSDLRERTKANLRLRIGMFGNAIRNLPVSEIDMDAVEAYLAKRTVSTVSRENDRRAISRFFHYCMEHPRRWVAANPCRREFRIRKPTNGTAPPVLTIDECKKLLTAAQAHRKGRLVPYVALCLFAGLRPFEAQRLTWRQINLKDMEIRIEAWQSKTGRPRVVTIGPTLNRWLKRYKNKVIYPKNWRKDFDIIKAAAGFGNPKRLTEEQRKKTPELKPWPDDVMRHTAISHYFRETGSYGHTAEQFGNSEAIIRRHYDGTVSSEDTKKFYALLPVKKGGRK